MSDTKQLFLKEINRLSDKDYIFGLGSRIGKEYTEMIRGMYGDNIVETGISMLSYLLDLLKTDYDSGMSAIKIIITGYPGILHSDILASYYDSIVTRRLFISLSKSLHIPDINMPVAVINVFLRWYTTTYELYRKMLIYNCYCHGTMVKRPINIENYLFGNSDPATKLKNESVKGRESLWKIYNPSLRHAIAHGNVIIIPHKFIVIRMSNDEKNRVIERKYNTADEFINEVMPDIEIMCNSIRFFFFILMNYLLPKYSELFKESIGNNFKDEVLVAIVKSISAGKY